MPELKDLSRESPPNETDRESEDPQGVDLWVMPYIRDSSLWPVLIVLIVHVVAFIAPLLLYAVRDQRTGPIIAMLFIAGMTLRGFRWEIRTRNEFGAISWLIVVSWIASFVAAYFADRHDFL
jgi:hypothetical protein